MSVDQKLDNLTTLLTKQGQDIQSIKEVLAGDEFGNDGLVTQHKTLKEQFYKTREEVRKIRIIGWVLSGILTFVIGLLSIFGE